MTRLSELVRRDLADDPDITGVTADSRKVRDGFLFAALPGSKADGRTLRLSAVTPVMTGSASRSRRTSSESRVNGHPPRR